MPRSLQKYNVCSQCEGVEGLPGLEEGAYFRVGPWAGVHHWGWDPWKERQGPCWVCPSLPTASGHLAPFPSPF